MMDIEVKGLNRVLRKVGQLDNMMKVGLQEPLFRATEHLRDKSIEHLRNIAKEPGLSVDGESITDTSNWTIIRNSSDSEAGTSPACSVTLKCISKHAAVVELGGGGKVIQAETYKLPWFPVGKQQGRQPPTKMGRITIPATGLHYLWSTVENKSVQIQMTSIMKEESYKMMRAICQS